jgi:hypothetical protein
VAREKVVALIKNLPEHRAAISEVRQIEINDYVEMPSPNKKDGERKIPEKIKGSIWSKLTGVRDIKVRSVSDMGPGDYNPKEASSKPVPSAAFKS